MDNSNQTSVFVQTLLNEIAAKALTIAQLQQTNQNLVDEYNKLKQQVKTAQEDTQETQQPK